MNQPNTRDLQIAADGVKQFVTKFSPAFDALRTAGQVLERYGSFSQAADELEKRLADLRSKIAENEATARKIIDDAQAEAQRRLAEADKRRAEILEAADKERNAADAAKAQAAAARKDVETAKAEHAALQAKIADAKAKIKALLEN